MQWLTCTIMPRSAFGSTLKGDMIFGQLCWLIRHRHGDAELRALLDGYANGRPFLVVGDAVPEGLVPRPEIPPPAGRTPAEGKIHRRRRYLPLAALRKPLDQAEGDAVEGPSGWIEAAQPHNSIGRMTGATGHGADPYQMSRLWPSNGLKLDIHVVVDRNRIGAGAIEAAFADLGAWGFGRDASIGLGRFEIAGWREGRPQAVAGADALMTLAPCAPEPGVWNAARSFWRPFTRFGRHGAAAVTRAVFKTPVLLADTAAVLTPLDGRADRLLAGRGLGGDGTLSREMPETVQQGYAPVLPVALGALAA